MSEPSPRPARRVTPPETGWTLGASGLPRPVWATLAVILALLAVLLFVLGYLGYGILVLVLGVAASVNLL
jgi:hypothetical protein